MNEAGRSRKQIRRLLLARVVVCLGDGGVAVKGQWGGGEGKLELGDHIYWCELLQGWLQS